MTNFYPMPGRKPETPYRFSSAAVNDDIKNLIRRHEKEVDNFYKDNVGNITIGIGQLVPDVYSAKNLPSYQYEHGKYGREATDTEKEDAFTKIQKEPSGQNVLHTAFNPSHNNNLSNLRLKKSDMEFMLESHLRQDINYLEKRFSEFRNFPASARKALQDMQFNLGPQRFSENK